MTARVLVTGGSSGIGRSAVELLAEEGWEVAFTWHSNSAAARKVECETGAKAYHLDLRARDRVSGVIREIEEAHGPLDGLVNNAGLQQSSLLALTTDASWDSVLDTNLGGTFRCCRAVVKGMVHRRRGSIVNMSSLSAEHGVAGLAAYAASKAGILALTRCLAREVGRKGVRVNAVIPGFVATERTSSLRESVIDDLRATECLPEGTPPLAVANAVAFLLSDRALAITGQTIVVDAGTSA